MKGDFTRLTFRRDKHYTSVRMQQGRLQLDSDWNEQADIQAHLYRTQVLDLIGAASGAPTSENDQREKTDKAYKESFKISVTSDGKDLIIAPGRFYVNGTLCQLEATPIQYSLSPSSPSERVKVDSLMVDGRKFEEGQWVKVQDGTILQIQPEINPQTLELPLSAKISQKGQLTRIVTYKTQVDYPEPEFKDAIKEPIPDGLYLVYLDVWQRHVTVVEDPGLREVALNIPDTTTRTQTVWQVKLRKFDRSLIQDCSLSKEEETALLKSFNALIEGFSDRLKTFKATIVGKLPDKTDQIDTLTTEMESATLDSINNLTQQFTQLITSLSETEKTELTQEFQQILELLKADPKTYNANIQALIQRIKKQFLGKDSRRQVSMNACAKLCPASGGTTSSDSGYRRLENQLYRVEIHDPGKVGEDPSSQKATFKWSRNNGSIVSLIEDNDRFEKGIIVIRKSAQDAWAAAKSGQWIEILNEERELKGQPGQLARLNRVSGNKIEFDVASLVGDAIPNSTKVRLWDHMTKDATILTRSEWAELEAGIKVKFYPDSNYKTGDYWVIPARAATNDIEWANDQTEDLNKRQPLPQAALGIEHDYALLAVVAAADGEFVPPQDEAQDKQQDQRFVFPALAYTFDTRDGVIQGDLEVKGTLTATKLKIPDKLSALTFQGSAFQIAKNPTTETPEPFGIIQLNNTDIEFKAEPTKNANFQFTGGNVAIAQNLQVSGTATIAKKTTTESLQVTKDAQIDEDITVAKKTTTESLQVTKDARIDEDITVAKKTTTESLQVSKDATVQDIQIGNDATIAKKTTTESLQVNKSAVVAENAEIKGNITIAKKTKTEELQVTTNATVTQKTTTESLQVNGTATVGNLEILGTPTTPALKVTGDATVTKTLTTDLLRVNTDLTLGKSVTGGTLRILGNTTSPALLEVNGEVRADQFVAKNLATDSIGAKTVLIQKSITSGTYHQISSRTLKEDITTLNSQDTATLLQALSPVRFIYTEDANKSLHLGFIAEDTPNVFTSADKQAVKLMDIVAVLTQAVKDQQRELKDQQRELEHLREKISALEAQENDRRATVGAAHNAEAIATPALAISHSLHRSRHRKPWFQTLKRFIRRLLT
ncbi:DUF6519 domain-containing protein [Leptolyngbya sp. FACHB-17]|uniref:DUF6519 domain-containing protein n=1 Tax=unclassified Leptolyngbya TaxID=2650499 RepID=UPI0016808865|nr:DUF6519 domain-containing protein [Leptolyngbya sp. FACHB-17]MBD2080942.1 tail fiber domain-containing protein [Leptolyngbya sp. FACHB-17]